VILQRTEGRETEVDSQLKAEISSFSHRSYDDNIKHTMILLTGDGNAKDDQGKDNYEIAHFPKVVMDVLAAGFKVEVWAWRRSMNRVYTNMQSHYPEVMSIHYLDEYYDLLVSVPRGSIRRYQGYRGGPSLPRSSPPRVDADVVAQHTNPTRMTFADVLARRR